MNITKDHPERDGATTDIATDSRTSLKYLVYEDERLSVYVHGGAQPESTVDEITTFTVEIGRGNFVTTIGPFGWHDLAQMIHFAIFPLGGDRTTMTADEAAMPRYLVDGKTTTTEECL